MWVVRFMRCDNKPCEDYCYSQKESAIEHLESFKDDDSALYESISVIDSQKNLVERILVFWWSELGMRVDYFCDRDIVRLKPGYRAEGEEKYLFFLTDISEITMRGKIVCINSGLSIPSAELVGLNMIECVNTNTIIPMMENRGLNSGM